MTNVSIVGAGNMARGIATRALDGGNSVQLLHRDVQKTTALAADLGAAVSAGALGEPLIGDLVVLAVPYEAAAPLVVEFGEQLRGKVIIDITNPVDWASFDRLVVPADSSAAEEIAKVSPEGTAVVKAFNTTFAKTLVSGTVVGQPLDVLIAGDDERAKEAVVALATAGGLHPIDAGPLRRARQLEQAGFLHMALQESLGSGYQSALRFLS
jgi:8-hydroxy-5-deazaflavin:NADPH oxidoreductase